MNAIAMLERDHVKVKRLLARLDATTTRATVTRRRLFVRIKAELTVHETIEEHNVVDNLLGELTSLASNHETWAAKATVMRENVEHHIEEEETRMFPEARRIFDRPELDALGRRMAARRVKAKDSVRVIAARRER